MKSKIAKYIKEKEKHKNHPFRIRNGQGYFLQGEKEIKKEEWEANNPVPEYHNFNEDNPDKTHVH